MVECALGRTSLKCDATIHIINSDGSLTNNRDTLRDSSYKLKHTPLLTCNAHLEIGKQSLTSFAGPLLPLLVAARVLMGISFLKRRNNAHQVSSK